MAAPKCPANSSLPRCGKLYGKLISGQLSHFLARFNVINKIIPLGVVGRIPWPPPRPCTAGLGVSPGKLAGQETSGRKVADWQTLHF